MCVYVCICVCVCIYMYIYICIYVCVCISISLLATLASTHWELWAARGRGPRSRVGSPPEGGWRQGGVLVLLLHGSNGSIGINIYIYTYIYVQMYRNIYTYVQLYIQLHLHIYTYLCCFVSFCFLATIWDYLKIHVVFSRSRSRDVEVEVGVVGVRFLRESSFPGSLLYLSREESLGNHFF